MLGKSKKKPVRKSAGTLKKMSGRKVTIFKIKNRRGYAAICQYHLTEGGTANMAFDRMVKAMKRSGFEITGSAPKPKK